MALNSAVVWLCNCYVEMESKRQDKLTAFSHTGVQALKADKLMVDLKKQYRFFCETH